MAGDDWRRGRKAGIPLCCRVRYCWDVLLNDSPSMKRPCRVDGNGTVPCGVFHLLTVSERFVWACYWIELAERDPEIAEIARSR